jgi:hypothetical protein
MSSRSGWLLLVAAVVAVACADLDRGDPLPVEAGVDGGPPATDSGGTSGETGPPVRSFARDVHPVLVDRCGRCHSASGQASDTALVLGPDPARDLAPVQRFVNRDNPAGSRLLVKGAGSGHGGGAILSAATDEYRIIVEWITQGSAP